MMANRASRRARTLRRPSSLCWIVPNAPSYPHMLSSWLTVGPEALYWGPKLVTNVWGAQPLYITENGASAATTPQATAREWRPAQRRTRLAGDRHLRSDAASSAAD